MKEIVILGTGKGWEGAPEDKETWAIAKAVCKKEYKKRSDMLFCMDYVDEMTSFEKGGEYWAGYTKEHFIEKVNETGAPFVTSRKYPLIPQSIEFPLKEISEKFGIMYYTNTICYMIAYAMHLGVDAIDLWGVNQQGQMEYIMERKGVEFWLGLAAGTGVRVEVCGPSPLLHSDRLVYGYKKTEQELEQEYGIWKNQ